MSVTCHPPVDIHNLHKSLLSEEQAQHVSSAFLIWGTRQNRDPARWDIGQDRRGIDGSLGRECTLLGTPALSAVGAFAWLFGQHGLSRAQLVC